MPPRRFQPNVRLPQSLLEEIATNEKGTGRHGKTKGVPNRKEQRKAERQQAKQKKAQHFSAHQSNLKRHADTETERQTNKRRRLSSDNDDNDTGADAPRKLASAQKPVSKPNGNLAGSAKTKISQESNTKRKGKSTENVEDVFDARPQRSRREVEEDAYISMLEEKLGLDKRKKGKGRYNTAFEDDGLLDLLVDLDGDESGSENRFEAMLNTAEPDDESDWDSEEGHEQLEEGEDEKEDEGSEYANEQEQEQEEEDNQWTGFGSEGSQSDDEGTPKGKQDSESKTAYVPPHLRKVQGAGEADVKLRRTLKGLLNRLSEQNIDSILKEIENLYRNHRRHDITETLTTLIIEGTCSHSILLDSYVALHAGLVACLHKIIGVELAAYFVQTVVSQFEMHYRKARQSQEERTSQPDDEPPGKECSNLLVLLSDLYNYHVISCALVYDVIRLILEGVLNELDAELILKLARGSGSQLRQDDPSALKDIVQIVQSKLTEQSSISSRTRFMVETLTNLKNNKVRKHQTGQGSSESKERITKFVNGIDKKYHVHAHEPLRISLEDLHQADTKGKWWLVGAAWGGDPLLDRQDERETEASAPAQTENTLLKLAKKQGMNTDVRRSIFVVLMSSEDYVDACDRLSQLKLTEVQQREIIRVLLYCCGNEKTYNPYYTLIGQHLCRLSHSHKVTLQYCLWDFLRSLGESGVGGVEMVKSFEDDENADFELDRISSARMANMAKAYGWWIAKDSVAITVLKTLDFVTLKPKTQTFVKQLFTQLFISTQDASSAPNMNVGIAISKRDSKPLEDVLLKALRLPGLARGILHFIKATFAKNEMEDEGMKIFLEWSVGITRESLQMGLEAGASLRVD